MCVCTCTIKSIHKEHVSLSKHSNHICSVHFRSVPDSFHTPYGYHPHYFVPCSTFAFKAPNTVTSPTFYVVTPEHTLLTDTGNHPPLFYPSHTHHSLVCMLTQTRLCIGLYQTCIQPSISSFLHFFSPLPYGIPSIILSDSNNVTLSFSFPYDFKSFPPSIPIVSFLLTLHSLSYLYPANVFSLIPNMSTSLGLKKFH